MHVCIGFGAWGPGCNPQEQPEGFSVQALDNRVDRVEDEAAQ